MPHFSGHRLCLLLWLILLGHIMPAGAQNYYNPVDLLQGRKKITIPFTFVHNFIVLEVRIYGVIPLKFIFDTGAEHIILFKREYTDLLQVPYEKRIPVMGSDLSREIYALITRNGMIEISGLPAKPYDMLVLEDSYFDLDEMIGTPIAGLIGGGFFRNLVINIDYKKSRITLHDPAHFQAPEGFIALPMRLKTNKPYISGEANLTDGTVVQVDLLLDTGAGVPLLLHTNSHPSLRLPDTYIRGRLGMGLGGYLEGYIGRTQKLSLGSFEFLSILTSFQDINTAWLTDNDKYRNGIVGNELLRRFNTCFDYVRGQLLLKPYDTTPKPFNMDRSGLVIYAFGMDFNQYIVKDVLDHSPAAEADIRPEDIILTIRGIPVRFFTLDGVNHILQKRPGKRIRLLLDRGGQKVRKEIVLRDLI